MSMFRRPTDTSSDSSSYSSSSSEEEDDEDGGDEVGLSRHVNGPTTVGREMVGTELTPTETLSSNDFSLADNDDVRTMTVEDHRTNMLAAVLDELSRYKALEMLNNASAGVELLTKDSPEVRELGGTIFSGMSQMLDATNLVPANVSSQANRALRQQYLAGLERFSFRGHGHGSPVNRRRSSSDHTEQGPSTALVRRNSQQQPLAFMGTTQAQLEQLAYETSNLNIIRRPSAEFRLSTAIRYASHYENTFEERGILGKGGFGRVYHTVNILDRREYAVKKIPLSPRLSERYRQGGHQELTGILKEVQALARLDHCNVVRYYGAWLQAPTATPALPAHQISPSVVSFRGQRLLEAPQPSDESPHMSRIRPISSNEADDFDPFERDDDTMSKQDELWSYRDNSHQDLSGIDGSIQPDIFTEGNVGLAAQEHEIVDHSSVYVLHVQMSMYPMTLAQYIDRHSSPRSQSTVHAHRHCFHLVPAIRIMLALLAGVMYIHSQGLIHRDIKPTNIFLDAAHQRSTGSVADGFADVRSCPSCKRIDPHRLSAARAMNPRIGDFGLVAELQKVATDNASPTHPPSHGASPTTTLSEKAVGTEYYRPPPFYYASPPTGGKGKRRQPIPHHIVDEKLDVFALGVIFLELLCACSTRMERMSLLEGCQRKVLPNTLKQDILDQSYDEQVAEEIANVLQSVMEPDPEKRLTCGQFSHSLRRILDECNGKTTTLGNGQI